MDNDETKMIKDMADTMDKLCCERFALGEGRCGSEMTCGQCQAKDLYEAGWRKIADDEMVINKNEYVVIPNQDWEDRVYIHAMENHLCQKCRDMIGEKFVAKEEADYWKNRCKEIGDVASKETAREILLELRNKLDKIHFFGDEGVIIELIAEERGIKLEDNNE